jgi:lipopolysaccharide biosynthesis protein
MPSHPERQPGDEDEEVRVVAFYLPQFHPIPENDLWWGAGFTEWTNVAGARPRYPGHYQPRLPGELGFYDLRLAETREAQAALAAEYGVSAFCYWHYWFGDGRRLLERPFDEVLASGRPEFPFCLGWANQTWSGIWHGAPDRVLVEQTYPERGGERDFRAHFDAVLPALMDPRYLRIDGRPLFFVYEPGDLPEPQRFLDLWRSWAVDAGLPGIFFVGRTETEGRSSTADFDAFTPERVPSRILAPHEWFRRLARKVGVPPVRSFRRFSETMPLGIADGPSVPTVMPGFDNTPRSGAGGVVLHGAEPAMFQSQVARAVAHVIAEQPVGRRVVFVKSWNEWAEGNYLEPDRRYGRAFLEALAGGIAEGSTLGCRGAPGRSRPPKYAG